ncbi:ESCRT-II complex subunit VPS22 [Galdieria sulphuraria]|uniref:ESCRT-II complex subunit VPS22 n=1 Tax=Galdieria sulphuraria TaxID=130081 RepID=M2W183_GALSU|nr:ESCRT-II complex subunit VPS22 [Galdieria sulphuraria]EME29396.1 ESCRT-II complex subunit VPS22 [Galdieria sulphuraria]|eukprot:XP_005705916.1 ESCRT-II complex subunit VPS22 [Galdieria sulphuraria]
MLRGKALGLAGLRREQEARQAIDFIASSFRKELYESLQKQLDVFRENLVLFARKYRKKIENEPEFRAQFHRLCISIGVDPLVSKKGFWEEVLGMGDFYYELAVKISEICIATRDINGGLILLDEIKRLLDNHNDEKFTKRTSKRIILRNRYEISRDDIERAVQRIQVLGKSYSIVSFGNIRYIQSVPGELSHDHSCVLSVSKEQGFTTERKLAASLKWSKERILLALKGLLEMELAWIDDQDLERLYWFPSLYYPIDD